MSRKILIITGDAGESYETLYAKHRLAEAGFVGEIAAPTKKLLNLVIHDFEPGWDTYKESPGYKVAADLDFEEVITSDYDAVLLLGGRAPEYLRHNPKLIEIVRALDRDGKWIFSICHGIQILLAAGLARGKHLTCYEHIRFELESMGGIYCTPEAIRDGRIVSGQTWESHPDFYKLIFECLAEE